jgi:hypothetical protein
MSYHIFIDKAEEPMFLSVKDKTIRLATPLFLVREEEFR